MYVFINIYIYILYMIVWIEQRENSRNLQTGHIFWGARRDDDRTQLVGGVSPGIHLVLFDTKKLEALHVPHVRKKPERWLHRA